MPLPSLSLARDANFRALWIGQLVSIFGDRFTYLALLAVVVAHARLPSNPAAELAILPLASFLPAILFSPWIGAWVDRSDTRRVLILSDAARGVAVLAMIPATQLAGLPALYALVFLLYVANTFFLPARSAIVPLLVARERLTEANSWMTLAGVAATIAGSLAGGALIARFGWRWGFGLDALTYFVSVVALWRIRLARRAGDAAPGLASAPPPSGAPAARPASAAARYRALTREIREGFAILLRTPRAWGATIAVMLLWTLGGVLHVGVPILAGAGEGSAGRVASGVGLLLAAAACGMVAGTLLLVGPARGVPSRARLVVALIGTGLAVAGFAAAAEGWPAAGAALVAGFFVAVLLVTTETVLQEAIPEAARGRVFALRDMAARIAVLAAAGITGAAVAGGAAPRSAVAVAGVLAIVAGLAGAVIRGGEGGNRGTRLEGAGDEPAPRG
ncbi:MAG TPA: MFS transporter [Candidatus Eisenbacteria bacterium]|nr:MFS transporter [Candidatus Eisenbacteria bacterium]